MATAMAGPDMAEAKPPTVTSQAMPSCLPRVSRIVPMSREQNRPWAMAPMASTPYRLGVMIMLLRFKKSENLLITKTFLFRRERILGTLSHPRPQMSRESIFVP